MFIRKICDINGFDPPPAAAAVWASEEQRLNTALIKMCTLSRHIDDTDQSWTHSHLGISSGYSHAYPQKVLYNSTWADRS